MKSYFKNLLDINILSTIIVLLILCTISTIIFSRITPDFKKNLKSKFFPYILVLILVYGLVTFLGNNKMFLLLNQVFIFHQIIALGIGILHNYLYRNYFKEFEEDNIWKEALFALIITLYALIPFVAVYTFLNGHDFTLIISTHCLFLMVPTWFYIAFTRAIIIPSRIYLTWDFPAEATAYKDLADDELKDMVVLSFNISKSPRNNDYLTLRAKAPTRADFGRIFYHFIMDYNEDHSTSIIETNDTENSYSWVFFLKENWYTKPKYIDPNYTLYMNGINDNSRILCYRMKKKALDNYSEEEDIRELDLNKY